MPLNSFQDVKDLINQILAANGQKDDAEGSRHGDFWNNLTYDKFTTGNVPGVLDKKTHQPVRILIPKDSAASAIIQLLSGIGLAGPGGSFPRMPADGPPYFSSDQIKQIADWIDAGCPQ